GKALDSQGVELQLERVQIGAKRRFVSAYIVGFVVNYRFVEPKVDLAAQHDVLDGKQEIELPLDPGGLGGLGSEIACGEAVGEGDRLRMGVLAWGAGKQSVHLTSEF